MSISPTVDVFEALILVAFLAAAALSLYNAGDAWANELAAIDAADPDVALLGLEDFLRACTKLTLMALPGVVVAASLMTVPSPIQAGDATPQELVTAITLRVMLLLFAGGLLANAALSGWLRRRMARRRREAALAVADGAPAAGVEAPAAVVAPRAAPAEGED